jgi:hypothetical protein
VSVFTWNDEVETDRSMFMLSVLFQSLQLTSAGRFSWTIWWSQSTIVDIRSMTLDQIEELTFGPENTPAKLDLRREVQHRFPVTLRRHVPGFVTDSKAEASDALVDNCDSPW